MKTFTGSLAIATIAILSAALVRGEEQVDRGEIVRLGDHFEHIDGKIRDAGAKEAGDVLAAVPADDNHKWFISVIGAKSCTACNRLRADIAADQAAQKHLGAFITLADDSGHHSDPRKSWSHYHYWYSDDRSQQFRWEGLRIAGYPTIIVQPPLNKKYGDPTTVVFLRTGYDGKPENLCRDISAAVKAYIARQVDRQSKGTTKALLPPPARAQIVGGHGQDADVPDAGGLPLDRRRWPFGVDPPWTPVPKVDPVPTPSPTPDVAPYEIPPRPRPDQSPDAVTPQGPAGTIGPLPELTIVVDGNVLSAEDRHRLAPVIDRITSDRPGLVARTRDWRECRHLPVSKADLPAVVLTSEGRVDDKVSSRLLPFLTPEEPQPPRAVGLSDIPWGTLLSLLMGGGVGGAGFIGLAVFGLRAFRAIRQARGQTPFIDDAAFGRLLELLQGLSRPAPPAADNK